MYCAALPEPLVGSVRDFSTALATADDACSSVHVAGSVGIRATEEVGEALGGEMAAIRCRSRGGISFVGEWERLYDASRSASREEESGQDSRGDTGAGPLKHVAPLQPDFRRLETREENEVRMPPLRCLRATRPARAECVPSRHDLSACSRLPPALPLPVRSCSASSLQLCEDLARSRRGYFSQATQTVRRCTRDYPVCRALEVRQQRRRQRQRFGMALRQNAESHV